MSDFNVLSTLRSFHPLALVYQRSICELVEQFLAGILLERRAR